jgi:hypothetical protein
MDAEEVSRLVERKGRTLRCLIARNRGHSASQHRTAARRRPAPLFSDAYMGHFLEALGSGYSVDGQRFAPMADDDYTLTAMGDGGSPEPSAEKFSPRRSPAPSPIVLDRRSRQDERVAAERVLAVLDELDGARKTLPGKSRELPPEAFRDRRLLEAKETLKSYPPIRVRCDNGHHLCWAVITPFRDHGLQLVFAPILVPPGRRQGGAFDTVSDRSTGATAVLGTEVWVKHAAESNVQPISDGAHGDTYGLSGKFQCQKCRPLRSYKYRHVTLLRLWLDAVLRNDRQIEIGNPLGTHLRGRTRDRGVSGASSK